MYKRLVSAKPHYKTQTLLKEYKDIAYRVEMNSHKNKGFPNPNINFETPDHFKKKFQSYMTVNNSMSKIYNFINLR